MTLISFDFSLPIIMVSVYHYKLINWLRLLWSLHGLGLVIGFLVMSNLSSCPRSGGYAWFARCYYFDRGILCFGVKSCHCLLHGTWGIILFAWCCDYIHMVLSVGNTVVDSRLFVSQTTWGKQYQKQRWKYMVFIFRGNFIAFSTKLMLVSESGS